MKNEINRQLFKEKTQVDSYSIKQVFDAEKARFSPKFLKQFMQKQKKLFVFYGKF